MSEEAWSSLNGMYASKEDSEFLTNLLSGFSSPNELSGVWSSDQETSSLVCSSDFCNSNECLVSQETSTFSPDDGQSILYHDGTFFHSDDVSMGYERPTAFPRMGSFCDNELEGFHFARKPVLKSYSLGGSLDQYDLSDIGKLEKHEMNMDGPRQGDLPNANAPESKKRSRNVTDVSRSKRNLKSDKYQKVLPDSILKNGDNNAVIAKRKPVPHSTEEHSNVTHEVTNEETSSTKTLKASNGKGKSGKGASNDVQSLYARKRRERINERLRILQGLVPNGTKVDISTMLEEAVQYVKFLQLQIKLLSSDETWMYAPLAYNGMDIGISNFDITTSTIASSR